MSELVITFENNHAKKKKLFFSSSARPSEDCQISIISVRMNHVKTEYVIHFPLIILFNTHKKKLSQWSHAIYNYLTTVVYNRESLACEASEQLNELYQNIVVMTVNKCK